MRNLPALETASVKRILAKFTFATQRDGIGMSRQSKFLSLILRHKPEEVGITLHPAGWVRIDVLLHAMRRAGHRMSREELEALVETNDKKRFTISEDGEFIRAAQGHSIKVDLGLKTRVPPLKLYHGTARQYLDSIFSSGLRPMRRTHVHLSVAAIEAEAVGRRHGKVIVLEIAAHLMHAEGHHFFVADNGVWLTETVPAQFLSFWS